MGYRGKVDEQNRARDLRAQGWTLGEICEELGVSKASASLWCREVEIDVEALERRRRLRHLAGNEGARARGPNKLQRRAAEEIDRLRIEGAARIGVLTSREMLLVGAALYAGEGSKTPGEVRSPTATRAWCCSTSSGSSSASGSTRRTCTSACTSTRVSTSGRRTASGRISPRSR